LEAKAILLIMIGPKKWKLFERALSGDRSLPVTALLKHPDLTILTDQVE
jgi:6-phosphogluconolactonase/glucosamine-6-phosphate isomerase/deaminase